ncbi:MAG: hypothetical protein U0451_00990 [Candidatus Saccharimonadales bacterium]
MGDTKSDRLKKSEKVSSKKTFSNSKFRAVFMYFAIVACVLVSVILLFYTYAFAVSPAVIRKPKLEHYHFRMQILVNGKAEDFSTSRYQVGYSKDQCNTSLPVQPIHFHDNKDQFVHIHWNGMTGGMVMKYYGWNFIGGKRDALGYKMDDLTDIQKVSIHGDYLPTIPHDANFYIYIGDESGFKEKGFDDWVRQDLEDFFDTRSNFPGNDNETSLIDRIFPKTYAHDGEDHSGAQSGEEKAKLTRINNLVGNVVIFVQADRPTDAQIHERFQRLVPLSDSTCGG